MSEIGNGQDNSTEEYGLSIKNFIGNKYPICREERQYALFLYNILRYYSNPERREEKKGDVQEIFKACGLDNAVVEHVFYEATFMRDFFERERRLALSEANNDVERRNQIMLQKSYKPHKPQKRENKQEESFNSKLIQYVCNWELNKGDKDSDKIKITYSGDEYNLGQNAKGQKAKDQDTFIDNVDFEGVEFSLEEEDRKNRIQSMVRWMMNVKPDIAVTYYYDKNEEPKYLLFLECKFDSGETYYKCGDDSYKQSKIQGMVAEFLCEEYLNAENIEVSDKMGKKEKKACLVKFVRKDVKDGEILIEQLINLNNEIFDNQKSGDLHERNIL